MNTRHYTHGKQPRQKLDFAAIAASGQRPTGFQCSQFCLRVLRQRKLLLRNGKCRRDEQRLRECVARLEQRMAFVWPQAGWATWCKFLYNSRELWLYVIPGRNAGYKAFLEHAVSFYQPSNM